MKLVIFGNSIQKEEILSAFSSENFSISSVDSLDKMIEMSLQAVDIVYVLINPDENTMFTIGQLKELKDNVGVCVFDKVEELNVTDFCIFDGIDFIIKGVPSKSKLKKLKKLFPDYHCASYKAGLEVDESDNFCLLDSFLNLVSSGFMAINRKGNIVLMNNVFRQMTKRFGKQCEIDDSFKFLDECFPALFNLVQPYFEEGICKNRVVTTVETKEGVLFAVNIVPVFVKSKLISVVLFIEHSYSAEIEIDSHVGYDSQLSAMLQKMLKAFDYSKIGNQIVSAAVKLTGIKRVFLSYGFEGDSLKTEFRGFFQWEKDILKKFNYDYNVQKTILDEGNLIADNVYLIPQIKLLDFSDLCLVSEETGIPYNLLFVPVRGKKDELLGILRFDIGEGEKPYIKGFHLLQEFLSHVAVLIENIFLHNNAEANEKFMRNVVNNINDVVLVLGSKLNIVSSNTAIKSVLGYEREDVVGRNISCLLNTDVVEKLRQELKQNKANTIEAEIKNKKNEQISATISISSFQSNRKNRIVLLISDITYLKDLKDKELELQKLEAISQIAVVANDKINTPLTIILAHLGILKYKGIDTLTEEELHSSLSVMDHQVNKVSRIMKKLRNLQKLKTKSYAQRDILMLDLDSVDSSDSVDSMDYFDED